MNKLVEDALEMMKSPDCEYNPMFISTLHQMFVAPQKASELMCLLDYYWNFKDIYIRSILLRLASRYSGEETVPFLKQAFRRCKQFDMRFSALKGLAPFLSESEFCSMLSRYMESFVKALKRAPLDYSDIEFLQSDHGISYLLDRYPYPCILEAKTIFDEQYACFPSVLKGIFHFDSIGNIHRDIERSDFDHRMNVALDEIRRKNQ